MYSGKHTVKIRAPKEFVPDLSTTSRARKSLSYAQANLKPEQAQAVQAQVSEAFPDMLIERRRV